ncbi:CehA/McbA family metallohydrolase [Paenibacillus oryzisoli]|uniref:CehA/McbA family metallohydrolase n=1 Tax=Paenibacillus oryzisoli TaxID=1850517 RepID=UPI003D2B9118
MLEQSQNEHTQPIVLLSQGTIAAAENELEGFEAEKAIDGRDDTYWAGAPYYVSWRLDLLKCSRITQLVIDTGAGEAEYTHYFVEFSQDRLNWETAAEKRDNTETQAGGDTYNLFIIARYIRVTVTYCSPGATAKIRNVHVYGYAGDAVDTETDKVPYSKFPAANYDQAHGFSELDTDDIEPGETYSVITASEVDSYLVYHGIDFTEAGVDQLRGQFGFTDSDRNRQITLEVRVDDLHGEKIGEIVLFKQWKRWSILAGCLAHSNSSLLTGIHNVYLVMTDASPGQRLLIHWLAFVKQRPLTVPKPRPSALPAPIDNKYNIYFGNLHSHTGFSDGIGVPEEAYDYARYTAGIDFLAITEHSNLYDHYLDWDLSRKWADIRQMADTKTEDGAFLALYGAETTWYNQFGHMNTYNLDFFINTYETKYNDIPQYYDLVKRYPDSIHQWNHPWSSGDRHLDGFEPYDAQVDEVLHLIETNPIESEELGGLYYYIMALDKGWHVAPVGNQDNHHGLWGTQNTLRTAVLVEKLTKEHFYDAIRHQRVYFTSALQLKVWFTVNSAIMGSRIQHSDMLLIEIKALYGLETGCQIVRTEIIGERGRVLHAYDHRCEQLEYQVALPCEERFYFAKIYQENGEFAATAPVWIEMD